LNKSQQIPPHKDRFIPKTMCPILLMHRKALRIKINGRKRLTIKINGLRESLLLFLLIPGEILIPQTKIEILIIFPSKEIILSYK
jgi:hypothetical protein